MYDSVTYKMEDIIMGYRIFENLNIEVTYVNQELLKGRSLTKIALEDYGYKNESSLRKRLTKGGIYKRVGQQFIRHKLDIDTSKDESDKVRPYSRHSVTDDGNTKISDSTEIIEVVDVTKSLDVTLEVFEEKYKGLAENYNVLMQMIQDYKKAGIEAIKNDGDLVIELPPETKEARVTFRINGTIYEEFKEFVTENNQFNVKEIISAALQECSNNYKKYIKQDCY